MAQGFGEIQRSNIKDSSGYETIFEKITTATNGESKSYVWYKNAVRQEVNRFKEDHQKFHRDERYDALDPESEQDENVLRRYAVQGHMYLFEYKAQSKYLPYWDKFPLVYCIKSTPTEFFGANLHYMAPKKRILAIRDLMKGRINLPKACFHKYLKSNVEGLLLDLASEEWDTAILLPVEDFVITRKDSEYNFRKEEVWSETNQNFYDRIRARKVVRGYGTQESVAMVR
jgi:hypothetical protein|tara:strand:- start:131 stop:817 length:687 start_codon:yes stop_codon:yes gene_type:complete